ncbi:hypothetical protein [Streptomyces sp. NPDC088733]|uniref:hypothetical protein n=1 Tax=Streptomyces sp. NPDC088733 TaxID=3365880 RepID=UPI0037F7527E
MTNPIDLLKRTEHYLSALHGSVGRHDNLAANYACAGCELRDQIQAALSALATLNSKPGAIDRVRQLHARVQPASGSPAYCAHCVECEDRAPWPCATIRALDGLPEPQEPQEPADV